MDKKNNSVILYSPQADIVWNTVINEGIAYSRREYVRKKYEECADIFMTAYDAYVREAEKIVPHRDDKAYPYWAFASMEQIDGSGGNRVMKLSVPVDEIVFFDQYDWYKVLRLSYVAESQADEQAYSRKLETRGIHDASEVVLKPFYPDLKREIIGSWNRIFRHDSAIKEQIASGAADGDGCIKLDGELSSLCVQTGLWCIKREWLCNAE